MKARRPLRSQYRRPRDPGEEAAKQFTSFKIGDRVAHINLGDGSVTDTGPDYIVVTYGRRIKSKGPTGGMPIVGRYDARWFEINPGFLFHRFGAR